RLNLENPAEVVEFLHTAQWPMPSASDYHRLADESEYAAWVIYNRYYLNHYTLAVHNFRDGYHTIPAFNEFLERNGIVLNSSGGKIKVSEDGGLIQSSTMAGKLKATFSGGEEQWIPGSYVEFAERCVLPQFAGLPKD